VYHKLIIAFTSSSGGLLLLIVNTKGSFKNIENHLKYNLLALHSYHLSESLLSEFIILTKYSFNSSIISVNFCNSHFIVISNLAHLLSITILLLTLAFISFFAYKKLISSSIDASICLYNSSTFFISKLSSFQKYQPNFDKKKIGVLAFKKLVITSVVNWILPKITTHSIVLNGIFLVTFVSLSVTTIVQPSLFI
jgi:Na+/melibiose symporter-like transporter